MVGIRNTEIAPAVSSGAAECDAESAGAGGAVKQYADIGTVNGNKTVDMFFSGSKKVFGAA